MTALTLDHLVIAVRDLETATASYRRLLGRAPSWRGRHPAYGTANVLFRLDNCYLELLAPAGDGAASPWRTALQDQLDTTGEGLYAIALGTDDIEATVAGARARGLEAGDPAGGEGLDLDTGARREWRNARIPPEATRGVRAFFIEHSSPPDAPGRAGVRPLPAAPPDAQDGAYVLGVDHTVIASSDLAACLRLWHEALGLDLRLSLDRPGGRRLHFLRLGPDGAGSVLELAGDGVPERPGARDLLWGVAYRVGNVGRAVARLRAASVAVSDPRPGNAPGTAVADLKPGFYHEVQTLFIEKEGRA